MHCNIYERNAPFTFIAFEEKLQDVVLFTPTSSIVLCVRGQPSMWAEPRVASPHSNCPQGRWEQDDPDVCAFVCVCGWWQMDECRRGSAGAFVLFCICMLMTAC